MNEILHVLLGLGIGYVLMRLFVSKQTIDTLINNDVVKNKILDLEAKRRSKQAEATLEELKREVLKREEEDAKKKPVSSDDFNADPPK